MNTSNVNPARNRRRRNRGGSNNRRSNNQVVRVPRSVNPLPFVLDTDFEMIYSGQIAAGNCLDNACSFNVADLYQPFNNVTYKLNNTATGSTPMACSPTLGSSITNSPIGYGFAAVNYQLWKVLSYDLSVTVNPQGSGDTLLTALIPTGGQENPTSGTWNWWNAASQNGVVRGQAVHNVPTRSNTLRLRSTPYRALGYSRAQWMAQPNNSMNTTSTIPSYVVLFVGVQDGSANVVNIVVNVSLRLRVRLTDPQALYN